MKYKTIEEATRGWVREMNAFPQDMIATLMRDNIDDWCEITTPSVGDRVYIYDSGEYGYIMDIIDSDDDKQYKIELDEQSEIVVKQYDFEVQRDDYLPMWGTMWQFGDSTDDYWLEELNGIELMSECGFRIYEHPEWGYFFGIDGAGYSFYEAHWIPLYKARGLHWHEMETED